MSTTTRRAPRACKAAKPVYPELPESGSRDFWLAAFLRDSAEFEAIKKLLMGMDSRNSNYVTRMAICGAAGYAANEANSSAKRVAEKGLLPFAHAHTTYFAHEGGAA